MARTLEKGLDDATLSQQAAIFKQFLKDTLNHPELRRSFSLEKFLLVPNYDDFTEQKKNVDTILNSKKDIRVLISKKTIESDNLSDFPLEGFKTNTGTVK